MKKIPLSQGLFALVDDADFKTLSSFNWYALKVRWTWYAARNIKRPDGTWTTQLLHRLLLPDSEEVDHRDGNGLNNQRKNIRAATSKQNNQAFQRKARGASSCFRGVSLRGGGRRWAARIQIGGAEVYLGSFKSELDAARAYDVAAQKYWGDFSQANFPV